MSKFVEMQAVIDALYCISSEEGHLHIDDAVEEIRKLLFVDPEIFDMPSEQPHSKELSLTQKALDCISRQDAIDAIIEAGITEYDETLAIEQVKKVSPAQPEWNNHTVACLLADLFDDACACNYNGNDEWLPEKCEVIDSCPNPVGVACWEQFLKHKEKRNERSN